MQISIVSLNLGGYAKWQNRITPIVDYLDREKSDVLLLQEVQFDPNTAPHNQASELNSHLKSSYNYESISISRFYRPSVGEPYREGLAILSRFPIITSEVLALTQASGDKHVRLIQNADLQLENQELKISNVHFSNNTYSPEQLSELMVILSGRNEKRIIAGDFNIFNIHEHKAIYETDYSASIDFASYVSYPSESTTIDYMLLPHEYKYQSIVATSGLSDHAALSYMIST